MRPLVFNVHELMRRPGNEKDIEAVVTATELDLNDSRIAGDAEVVISLRVESLSDGLTVIGRASVAWTDSCSRCLEPAHGDAVARVRELYQERITDEDAYPILGEQVDLAPMVREVLLLEVPTQPVCQADCAGLCPSCGINRNEGTCDCDLAITDDRWAALDALKDSLG